MSDISVSKHFLCYFLYYIVTMCLCVLMLVFTSSVSFCILYMVVQWLALCTLASSYSLNTCSKRGYGDLKLLLGVNGCLSLCISPAGDLFRVYPASRPMVAGIGFSPLVTLIRVRGWMDVSFLSLLLTVLNSLLLNTQLHQIITYPSTSLPPCFLICRHFSFLIFHV